MKLRFPALIALLCSCQCFCQEIDRKTDELLTAYSKLKYFSGSALVAKGNTILFDKGYGMSNYELEVANKPNTKFRIGSVTKQFTAMCIMMLAERGLLKTEDSITKHLPDCPEAWEKITIHHLLTHTSGLESYTDLLKLNKDMRAPASVKKIIDTFKDKKLKFEPGTKFEYCNSGYLLLGYVVEKIYGKGYEAFLRENIFDVVGMKDSGYDHGKTVIKNRADGYTIGKDGYSNCDFLDMSWPYAAGALYSTVEDLYKWDRALYTEKLLKKETLAKIFTPFKGDYGYGWVIGNLFGHKLIWHNGMVNGFRACIKRFVDDDVCIVVLANCEASPVEEIARGLAAILFGEKYSVPKEHVEAKVDPKLYDSYIGEYELRPGFTIKVTRENDRLYAQATAQPRFEIFPEADNKFFLKAVDAQIEFKKSENGEIQRMVLFQNGMEVEGKKK